MLLHLPTHDLTPDHFLDTTVDREVLRRMAKVIAPPMSSYGAAIPAGPAAASAVHVFDHDIYTIVLAGDPTLIPDALSRVDPARRPRIDPDLFDFYAENFSDHSFVLCCFNNTESMPSAPVMLWYPPSNPDLLTMPGIDCHTGGAPLLDSPVERDHTLIFGTDHAPRTWGLPVKHPRTPLQRFLPTTITGVQLRPLSNPADDVYRNGDFAIAHDDLVRTRVARLHRLCPALCSRHDTEGTHASVVANPIPASSRSR